MKIGWCRLTMLVEIDLNQGDVGFTGMRTGYMRELVKQGHTVKLLTKLTKPATASYEHIKSGGDPKELGAWDCSWFEGLEHAPDEDASDCDLLIVESSACNWMFHTNGKPAIRRCAEILDSYKGKVIIEQSDPDLPFPFGKLAMAEFEYSHEDNPYRLKKEKDHDGLEAYGWADHSEIFDDKEYYVCVRAESAEALMLDGMAKGKRFRYDDLVGRDNFHIVAMPQTYDFEHHNVLVSDRDTNEKEYDFIYTGFPRSDQRERKFDNYFLGNPTDHIIQRAVCGPWEKKSREHKLYDLKVACVDYAGKLPWAELPVFINKSKFTLYLGVSKAYLMNWQTNKPFETISSGSILLHDDINYLNEWFGGMFMLDDDNRELWMYIMYNATDKELSLMRKYQYNKIKHRSWDVYVGKLSEEIDMSDLYTGVVASDKIKPYVKVGAKVQAIISKYTAALEADKYWRSSDANRTISEDRKNTYDTLTQTEHGAPECFGEHEDTEDYCLIQCPFRVACLAVPPTTTADASESDPIIPDEPSVPTPAETQPPVPQPLDPQVDQDDNITISDGRSKVVICPCREGKTITISINGYTIQIHKEKE